MARPIKSSPFSLRLTQTTDRFVTAEAQRTKRSKGAIVEALTEEAARTRRFPGIAFRGDDADRRPWLIGTGLDIWELIELLEDHGSVERLIQETDIPARTVTIAHAYYASYPDEIDQAIAENRRPLTELQELYPFIGVTLVDNTE